MWEVGLQEADNGRHRAVVACRSLSFWNTESIEVKEKACRFCAFIISALHRYFVAFSLPLCFSLAWRRRMGRSGQKKKFPRQRRAQIRGRQGCLARAPNPTSTTSLSARDPILLTTHPAKSAIMDLNVMLEKVPKPVVLAFAALGAIVAAGKVFSYIQLLLSLFVLPGTNVSLPT